MPKSILSDLDIGVLLFLQLAVIIGFCRLMGYVGKKWFGQTQVVSEMIAGVILGPSVFGALLPDIQSQIFPKTILFQGQLFRHPNMQVIYAMSQVGLALYMFLVGAEIDLRLVRENKKNAAMVSLSGILFPFLLGFGLGYATADNGLFFHDHLSPISAGIFMGAAMCITAFPMLARIIYEMGLTGTSMGVLALSAGAIDDATAWAMLAGVLSVTKNDAKFGMWAIGGGVAYLITMLTAGKKILTWIEKLFIRDGQLTNQTFGLVLMIVLTGSWFTDAIGVYAVFGAFAVGLAMPKGEFSKQVQMKLESLVVTAILPLFFVFSGLNTKIGLVNTPYLWLFSLLVLVFAVVGKGVACTLASRVAGESWNSALGIGILMNSRGLMELIILNIGLQQGLIKETLFTVMVLMAVVTTLMTSPLFSRLAKRFTPSTTAAA